ncbi:hypothetical protein PMAYCL1PPCAC_14578 [Pristionchus mayeri]|uniref:Uncharacterized protein n=1 Tax=Pristionchus mayeri TaxID=1317129 RepID=A0AAN4ZT32_9BILA|nr:hypothetical protein PMAYCL1PPCAC_14578 [Pristionchus mayeri]
MGDDKTSKESKKKKVSGDNKGDGSEATGRKGRKKQNTSKRYTRQQCSLSSVKRSISPASQSPKPEANPAGNAQTTTRKEECRKKSTVSKSASLAGDASRRLRQKSTEKKKIVVPAPELSKKMTQAEYDKWCEAECEMWTPRAVFKAPPQRKFMYPACRLYKAETKVDDVPVVPSGTILGEMHERTRRYNNKSSVKMQSKKKLRKYKSSTEDKFTTKKD